MNVCLSDYREDTPVVIAGVGGSGTRAVCEIFIRSGYYMGRRLNHALDDNHLFPFMNGMSVSLIAATGTLDYKLCELPPALLRDVRSQVDQALNGFVSGIPEAVTSWGWKQPKTIFILPFINEVLPNFRFIHVVRDGRDMAFSKNKNQVTQYFAALFGEPVTDLPVDAVRWWSRANLEVARWAHRQLGERYFLLRYEDLCDKPVEALSALSSFTGSSLSPMAIEHIAPAPTRGRWTAADETVVAGILAFGKPGLEKFGYVPSGLRFRP